MSKSKSLLALIEDKVTKLSDLKKIGFREFDRNDWGLWAGANPGSLIYSNDWLTVIADPDGKMYIQSGASGGEYAEVSWKGRDVSTWLITVESDDKLKKAVNNALEWDYEGDWFKSKERAELEKRLNKYHEQDTKYGSTHKPDDEEEEQEIDNSDKPLYFIHVELKSLDPNGNYRNSQPAIKKMKGILRLINPKYDSLEVNQVGYEDVTILSNLGLQGTIELARSINDHVPEASDIWKEESGNEDNHNTHIYGPVDSDWQPTHTADNVYFK